MTEWGHGMGRKAAHCDDFGCVLAAGVAADSVLHVVPVDLHQQDVVLYVCVCATHNMMLQEALDASTVWNSNSMNRPAARCPLPDQLTPAHVHALLSDLRLSASQVLCMTPSVCQGGITTGCSYLHLG